MCMGGEQMCGGCFFFFFSSRRRHTRCREVSWARRCVQETVHQLCEAFFIFKIILLMLRYNVSIQKCPQQKPKEGTFISFVQDNFDYYPHYGAGHKNMSNLRRDVMTLSLIHI
eukprot:TRINITY_DN5658_c0_g1_i3.p2 TRINITY_DN5658_c0_g1~~TRINITY_DN5658_c0_g1_i3.p2  ORF type:complete len:113 (+),score=28.72 TRINITY_DN5658_c0_g1_i3:70-408(+)